jgi:6-pyruvoyltetrahydropterin/6-carboxytetrahydropterin synthase
LYHISVEDSFAAAHQLNGYKGKCENLHGHNWKVRLCVNGKKLNEIGLLMDFHVLKDILRETISELDHVCLNGIEYFKDNNPSSENIARFLSDRAAMLLKKISDCVDVESVTVWESATSRCVYYPD